MGIAALEEISFKDIPMGLRQDDTPNRIVVGRNIEKLSLSCVPEDPDVFQPQVTDNCRADVEIKRAYINDQTGDTYVETTQNGLHKYFKITLRTGTTRADRKELYDWVSRDPWYGGCCLLTETQQKTKLPIAKKYVKEGIDGLSTADIEELLRDIYPQTATFSSVVFRDEFADIQEELILSVLQNPKNYSAEACANLRFYSGIVNEVIPIREFLIQEGIRPTRDPRDQAILLTELFYVSRGEERDEAFEYLLTNRSVFALSRVLASAVDSSAATPEQRDQARRLLTLNYVVRDGEPASERREALLLLIRSGNRDQVKLVYKASLRDFPDDYELQKTVVRESNDPQQRDQAAGHLLNQGTIFAYVAVLHADVDVVRKTAAVAGLSGLSDDDVAYREVMASDLATPDQKAKPCFDYLEREGDGYDSIHWILWRIDKISDETEKIAVANKLRDKISWTHWRARGQVEDWIAERQQPTPETIMVLEVGDEY